MKSLFISLILVLSVFEASCQRIVQPANIVNGTLVNATFTGYNSPGPLATKGLIAYYKLDESSGTLYDSSTNHYDGTPVGTIIYGITGIVGKAVQGADVGVNKYATTTYNGSSNANWTISFWVNINGAAIAGYDTPLGMSDSTGANGWVINCQANYLGGGLQLVTTTNSASTSVTFTDSTFFNSTWQHVACVVSNGTMFAYTNGVLSTTATLTSNVGTSTTATFVLMHDPGHTAYKQYGFLGYLDEVGYWATNLTQTQVQYLAATNSFNSL